MMSVASKSTYLTDQARKQLGKKTNRPNIKKAQEEEEKSDYSDHGDDPTELGEEEELYSIAQFAGMMGQCFSDYRSYIKSLSRLC